MLKTAQFKTKIGEHRMKIDDFRDYYEINKEKKIKIKTKMSNRLESNPGRQCYRPTCYRRARI